MGVSTNTTQDETMKFPSGSLTVSVDNVLFKIPLALLQVHSVIFSSMIDVGSDSGEPIVLQDSVEAFREFLKVLLRPFESCLDLDKEVSHDLSKVLKVYTIAHKYCAASIEQRAKSIAISLTTADVVRDHISPTLTAIQIYDIALLVGCDEISSVLRNVIISDSWSGTIPPLDLLALGERHSDSQFAGLALYRIMLLGRDSWLNDPRITVSQGELLARGLFRFYEEWEAVSKGFAKIGRGCSNYGGCSTYSLAFREIAGNDLPFFDVIGRLRVLEQPMLGCNICSHRIIAYAQERREDVEKRIPELFSLGQPKDEKVYGLKITVERNVSQLNHPSPVPTNNALRRPLSNINPRTSTVTSRPAASPASAHLSFALVPAHNFTPPPT